MKLNASKDDIAGLVMPIKAPDGYEFTGESPSIDRTEVWGDKYRIELSIPVAREQDFKNDAQILRSLFDGVVLINELGEKVSLNSNGNLCIDDNETPIFFHDKFKIDKPEPEAKTEPVKAKYELPEPTNRHYNFAKYCQSIGYPSLDAERGDGDFYEIESPKWHEKYNYRIANDPHHELRREWADSDFTLQIEWKGFDGWELCETPLWGLKEQYRIAKAATQEPTQLGINPEMDKLARKNDLGHWSCVSKKSGEWWLRSDGAEWSILSFDKRKLTWMDSLKMLDEKYPIVQGSPATDPLVDHITRRNKGE